MFTLAQRVSGIWHIEHPGFAAPDRAVLERLRIEFSTRMLGYEPLRGLGCDRSWRASYVHGAPDGWLARFRHDAKGLQFHLGDPGGFGRRAGVFQHVIAALVHQALERGFSALYPMTYEVVMEEDKRSWHVALLSDYIPPLRGTTRLRPALRKPAIA
ncbi:hypothetical protein JNJ66_06410 [Candidatus Saccharibacteria bacterium]|nr:hypothetical protein [Candidatus Saccharibacteria bacterium]